MNHSHSNAAIPIAAVPLHPLDATVLAACTGNRVAIEAVYRQLRDRLVRKVRTSSSSPFRQDAEDLVQDLFVAMLERRLDLGDRVAGAVDRLMAHAVEQAR
jgi:DNA-directed RNA polymerase specialized sigma24 family protein